MSFDIAVWSNTSRAVKESFTIYERLCEGDITVLNPQMGSDNAIKSFLAELTARYPTGAAYSDEDIDQCVWNSRFDMSDAHVIIAMVYSRVSEVLPFISMLADKYDLTAFDPQNNLTRLPSRA